MAMIYKLLNPTMNLLLRSPAHRILSSRIVTIRYSGRRTGKSYATPVSYLREGNTVYCFTNGAWWHNFREPRAVVARIKGVSYPGTALASPANLAPNVQIMARYFAAVPSDAKFYGVRFNDDGAPEESSVIRAAQGMIMIQIELDEIDPNEPT